MKLKQSSLQSVVRSARSFISFFFFLLNIQALSFLSLFLYGMPLVSGRYECSIGTTSLQPFLWCCNLNTYPLSHAVIPLESCQRAACARICLWGNLGDLASLPLKDNCGQASWLCCAFSLFNQRLRLLCSQSAGIRNIFESITGCNLIFKILSIIWNVLLMWLELSWERSLCNLKRCILLGWKQTEEGFSCTALCHNERFCGGFFFSAVSDCHSLCWYCMRLQYLYFHM